MDEATLMADYGSGKVAGAMWKTSPVELRTSLSESTLLGTGLFPGEQFLVVLPHVAGWFVLLAV